MGIMLQEVVWAFSVVFNPAIKWHCGEAMIANMLEFRRLCSLPFVHRALDRVQIFIPKLRIPYGEDYYYKPEKHSMNV